MREAFASIDVACADEFARARAAHAVNPEAAADGKAYRVRLLTGFAEGTDLMAARLAPPHWEVEGILPAPKAMYEARFAPDNSSDGADRRSEFGDALKRAGGRIVELPNIAARSSRSSKKPTNREIEAAAQAGYARQGVFMLRQIDLLIAVWDGEQSERHGDTAEVVAKALSNGAPVLWLSSTDDRPPWLLTQQGDVEPETDPPNALDGPLQDAIARSVRPPSARAADAAAAKDTAGVRLEAFLRMKRRHVCRWTAYNALKIGWAFWRWRPTIPLDDINAVRDDWGPFLDRAPDGDGFRERLERILLPRFHAADQIATYYSHAYRSAYVLAYTLSTLAVGVTLVSTLPLLPRDGMAGLHVKAVLVVVELLLIAALISIVRAGRRGHWHGRWLDTRALAEQLRHARFLALVGETKLSRRLNPTSPAGESWVAWYLRATIRELGLPFGSLDPAYQRKALIATREYEVAGQITFNKENRVALQHLNHRLHWWGDLFFFAVAVVLVAYLIAWAINALSDAPAIIATISACVEDCGRDGPLGCALAAAKPWVVFLAAMLPAMGAATAGLRFTGDFEGFANRSRETEEGLSEMLEVFERAEDRLEFELTAETLASTARAMNEDLSGWRELYARKRLDLPA